MTDEPKRDEPIAEPPGQLQVTVTTRDFLKVVYAETMKSRLDFRGRIWSTVQFGAFMAGGTLAFAGAVVAHTDGHVLVLVFVGILLLAEAHLLGRWTQDNCAREHRLQIADEYTLFQIEKLWGLHAPIPEAWRWIKDCEYLFPLKNIDPSFRVAPHETKDEAGKKKDMVYERWVWPRFNHLSPAHDMFHGWIRVVTAPLWVCGLGALVGAMCLFGRWAYGFACHF